MFYLGTDQHCRQLTVNLRNQQGETILKRPVVIQPEKRSQSKIVADPRVERRRQSAHAVLVVCCVSAKVQSCSCRVMQLEPLPPVDSNQRDSNETLLPCC